MTILRGLSDLRWPISGHFEIKWPRPILYGSLIKSGRPILRKQNHIFHIFLTKNNNQKMFLGTIFPNNIQTVFITIKIRDVMKCLMSFSLFLEACNKHVLNKTVLSSGHLNGNLIFFRVFFLGFLFRCRQLWSCLWLWEVRRGSFLPDWQTVWTS